MKQLKLSTVLEFTVNPPGVVSFIGGGGKTTIISVIASELAAAGHKVLVTTTTKFYSFPAWPLYTSENGPLPINELKDYFNDNNLAVYGRTLNLENKIEGIGTEEVLELKNELPVIILVEADGSKGLPVKGYNPDEPVIPDCTDLVVALAGADVIGKPLTSEIAHRPEQLSAAINVEIGSLLSAEKVALIFSNMLKAASKQAPDAESICLLNKLSMLDSKETELLTIAEILSEQPNRPQYFIAAEAKSPEPIKAVFNLNRNKSIPLVSAVVLAAGSARRMGEDKLYLPYGQHTILEETLTNVKKADVDEIIVVVKPGSDWIVKLKNSGYIIVENHEYSSGQSSSLKAGLTAVSSSIQGVMFVLGDQPGIKPSLYNTLIEAYKRSIKLATAPVFNGKRGNPAIFDRRTWPILLTLKGDEGGRSIFNIIPEGKLEYIEVNDPTVLEDIDTIEDYKAYYEKYLQDQDGKKRI